MSVRFLPNFFVQLACLSLVFAGCNPLGSSGSGGTQGVCETADGSVINTYTVFGTWKKVQGYDPPRTSTELELNYELLMVLPGTTLCLVKVENGAVVSTDYVASYVHDVTQKTLDVEILNVAEPEPYQTSYSFAGSCDKTRMTLSYADSTVEQYDIVSKDTSSLNCGL